MLDQHKQLPKNQRVSKRQLRNQRDLQKNLQKLDQAELSDNQNQQSQLNQNAKFNQQQKHKQQQQDRDDPQQNKLNANETINNIGAATSEFILKLLDMMSTYNDIVGWDVTRKQLVIKDLKKMTEDVLPKYFRHAKFQSFVRQLNMYDFHKVCRQKTNQKMHFRNVDFFQGNQMNFCHIRRKKKTASSSNTGLVLRTCQQLISSKSFKGGKSDQNIQYIKQINSLSEQTKKLLILLFEYKTKVSAECKKQFNLISAMAEELKGVKLKKYENSMKQIKQQIQQLSKKQEDIELTLKKLKGGQNQIKKSNSSYKKISQKQQKEQRQQKQKRQQKNINISNHTPPLIEIPKVIKPYSQNSFPIMMMNPIMNNMGMNMGLNMGNINPNSIGIGMGMSSSNNNNNMNNNMMGNQIPINHHHLHHSNQNNLQNNLIYQSNQLQQPHHPSTLIATSPSFHMMDQNKHKLELNHFRSSFKLHSLHSITSFIQGYTTTHRNMSQNYNNMNNNKRQKAQQQQQESELKQEQQFSIQLQSQQGDNSEMDQDKLI